MKLFCLCLTVPILGSPLHAQSRDGANDRRYTVQVLDRIARPVIANLAKEQLKQELPLGKGEENRRDVTHLEALGRTLCGISPWLALGPDDSEEGKLRAVYIEQSRKAIVHATDPASPDFLNFTGANQALVDTAFLAQALLRAPKQLWEPLTRAQQDQLIAALQSTRKFKPYESNWLLFSACVEAAVWQFTGSCEIERIQYALDRHEQFYVGDGTYGDGENYHWDYYNSYVIQPAILDILAVCKAQNHPLAERWDKSLARSRRYAQIQEKLISPEGTYPVIGRSSTYRFGAFQVLSQMALMKQLPSGTPPAAVRSALTAVIRRSIEAPHTFDEQGWLRAGAVGYQPGLRESYVSTGSYYLCTFGLLHLGLPADDPLWTAPAEPWTQKRIWSGDESVRADHAYSGK